MDSVMTQWISIVTAGVAVASIVAVATILSRKANKSDVEAVGKALKEKANTLDVDKEFADLRLESAKQSDEGLRQYRELKTAIERLEREINLLDKHSLTSADLTEMKTDLKEALKQIDSIPARVTSLEATRNKQSEK